MPIKGSRLNLKDRFLSKIKKMQNGCHEWQSTLHRDGYGKFWYEGSQIQAHRMAYKLFVCDPEDKWVLHKCDNRKCVNPDHLFLGNSQDNIQDMDTKGKRGTKSKLTYAIVNEIKELLNLRYSQNEIGKKFGVHQGTISRIKLGKTTLFKS